MELIQGCRDRNEVKQVRAFLSENLPRTLYPDEAACRRAVDLLEQHAGPHGLRVVDALIGATALEAGCALATANVKHYRPISRLEIVPFKP
jgi:predicted nucleic acid-binding protein